MHIYVKRVYRSWAVRVMLIIIVSILVADGLYFITASTRIRDQLNTVGDKVDQSQLGKLQLKATVGQVGLNHHPVIIRVYDKDDTDFDFQVAAVKYWLQTSGYKLDGTYASTDGNCDLTSPCPYNSPDGKTTITAVVYGPGSEFFSPPSAHPQLYKVVPQGHAFTTLAFMQTVQADTTYY